MTRLAYIAKSVIPSETANSVHVTKMCAALASVGVDVRLFAHRGTPALGPEALARHYGLEQPVPYRLFDTGTWWDRRTWRRRAVRSAIRDTRAVLTRDIRTALMAGRRGAKTFLELHHPPEPSSKGARALEQTLRDGTRLVTITAALADHVASEWPVHRDAITVLQDGADVTRPQSVAPLRVGSRPLVGYVGSLLPGKGVETVLAVAPSLPGIDFVVVGGPEKARLGWQATVRSNNVRLLPRVPPADVPSVIAAFDVALLPNARKVATAGGGSVDIGAWTSPLKAFEYMAQGKAIVVSDLPNLREVFAHDRNGLLCRPEDQTHWAQAITVLTEDPALRARLGRAARDDLVRHYSWRARALAMTALIAQSSGASSPSPRR